MLLRPRLHRGRSADLCFPLVLPMARFIIGTGEDGKDSEAEHDLKFPSNKATVEDLQVSPAEAARACPMAAA